MILMNEEHQQIVKGWLPADLEGGWRLLFRASRDGFTNEAFHSRCDNKGPTITIVKSGRNIFGGFTELSWASKYYTDKTKVFTKWNSPLTPSP